MFLNSHDLLDDDKRHTVQQFIDNIPVFIITKNVSSQYLMGNNHYAKILGLSNSQALVGIYDSELNGRIKQIAHLFTAEDGLVMKKNHSITILFYAFYANDKPLLMYGTKYSLIDKNGTTVGCGVCAQDVTSSRLINLAPLLSLRNSAHRNRQIGDQFSYTLAESIPEYDLSKRQLECLFHLLRGQSANDIAITLDIGKRTVETHLDNIKSKLGCDTKSQLIDKALNAGLLNYVPTSLVQSIM
jgi:DNA-binding CsgD family transcriptional regulator